ncbi:hypothetical protein PVAND_001417 [Polypedilum vanderplanki]|uniref:Uncharacterized protein n=1 Tax=Polypedilum vanderplanki TaxID=319348 RepID=A0A9J6BNC4_POLVA|nr:hypothetical protein PVAND_001417 [Polypedilum vanderplanki]
MLKLLIFIAICVQILAIPSDIERCKLNDEKCLIKSANKVLKKYYEGNADLKLRSFDPMLIDYVNFVQDAGIVTVRGSANNSYASGLSKGKIEKIEGFDKNSMIVKFKTPKLNVNGSYKSIAKVVNVPINGDGKYKVTFNDFDVTLKSNLTRINRNGKEYFQIISTKMSFTASGGEINISDLGYLINLFLNASFDIIKNGLSSVISKAWSEHFEKVINEVLESNSIDELFLI